MTRSALYDSDRARSAFPPSLAGRSRRPPRSPLLQQGAQHLTGPGFAVRRDGTPPVHHGYSDIQRHANSNHHADEEPVLPTEGKHLVFLEFPFLLEKLLRQEIPRSSE